MNYIENSVGTYLHSKYLLYPLSNFRVHLIELFLPSLYVGITEQEGVDSLQRHGYRSSCPDFGWTAFNASICSEKASYKLIACMVFYGC